MSQTDPQPPPTAAGETPAPPAAELERPSSYSIKTLWASGLGYALEGYDNFILSFTLVAITATFSLTSPEAGSLATITLIGAVVGGFLFGILSDYFGRVKVLAWTMVLCSLATGAVFFTQNYGELVALRFIAGLAIGGEYGVGMALVSESWPKAWRGRAATFVAIAGQAGLVLALLVSTIILDQTGNWRLAFAMGVIPAVVALWYRLGVPEPEAFLKVKENRRQKAHKFPLRALFANARTTRSSLGIIILTSVQNFGYYGIITFLPTYLSTELGYSINQTAGWTAATVVGFILGMFVFGMMFDRVGRKRTFVIFMLGAVVSLVLYSQLQNPVALLIGGGVMGIFVNGMLGGYAAVTGALFPSEVLGTAQSVLYNIGRGIGAFSPLIIGFVAQSLSFSAAIGLLSLVYVVDILAILFLIPTLDRKKGAARA